MSPNKQSRTAHCCDYIVREDTWNAPKSMCRRYFARDGIYINFWNAPKSNSFSFFSFFCSKVDHVLNFLKCPIFESILVRMLLMFRKWDISKIKHVISFRTEKRKKTETVRFWGISKIYANALTFKVSPPHSIWGISSALP